MRIFIIVLSIVIIGTLTACNGQEPAPVSEVLVSPGAASPTKSYVPEVTPTATSLPPRVLTVCLGSEPASLFLYGDTTSAAQSIRQAIYDGPFDIYNYEVQPVILEKLPSLADGDAYLQPVEVQPGDLMMDNEGHWVALAEGVTYRPSECTSLDCAVSYTGEEPVLMDQLVARFRLLPGIEWSDGTALTASDSVYSYQVLGALYGSVPSELLRFTQSYQALDEQTVEWVGIPGYQSVYEMHFFTPLPQHIWGATSPQDLLVSEISTRKPLGWGAYVIDEWVAGDHISLSRNPNYFRAAEGLPNFDFLVFRFTETPEAALNALLAGECDFVDRSATLDPQLSRVMALQTQGDLRAYLQSGTAWEQITFGIDPADPQRASFFDRKEVRQAVAMCIDRQALANTLYTGEMLIPDTFVPVTHPLRNPDATHYEYDPETAAALLQFAGWIDHDGDPATPRISAGVPGFADGTPFQFIFLAPGDAERPQVAQQIVESLAQCGLTAELELQDWETLLGPGPDGPVFGRQFDLAQFAWAYSIQPSCGLYRSSEIPGPYPDYPNGWGGGNASGFSLAEYDQQCLQTLTALPDYDIYQVAVNQLQVLFADELPAIPLYQRLKLVAARPDLCGVMIDPAFGSALSTIEAWDYGKGCE
ncbi:MAG TPA: hypothetical protein DEH22_13205 [Chloroflexi bacterium]|nr:hypothetical protein [Chloroflexota bacterium]